MYDFHFLTQGSNMWLTDNLTSFFFQIYQNAVRREETMKYIIIDHVCKEKPNH